MTYMLDTNICIYIMKKKPESVLRRFWEKADEGICISSITLAEMQMFRAGEERAGADPFFGSYRHSALYGSGCDKIRRAESSSAKERAAHRAFGYVDRRARTGRGAHLGHQ